MIVKKSMYSVRLTDGLMGEFIERARSMGVDHSDLLDTVLNDFLRAGAGEAAMDEALELIASGLEPSGAQVYTGASNGVLYVKSALRYSYRPELKYTVEISGNGGRIGVLKVALRTERLDALDRFNRFTRLWASLEEHYARKYFAPEQIEYVFESGRFVRTLMQPAGAPPGVDALGRAVGAYVLNFDKILRLYLTRLDFIDSDVEKMYIEYLGCGTPV